MTTSALPEALLLCPHCVAPIDEADDFCPKCGGPVTSHASIDPMGQIYAAGYAYRQAVSDRPRLIVVIGMWLIFGPQLLGVLALLLAMAVGLDGIQSRIAYEPDSLARLGYAAILVAALCLYGLILGKVTLRYRAGQLTPASDEPDAPDDEL